MRLLLVNAVLLALVALAVVGVQVLARPEVAVEASARRYAAAVSVSDLNAALDEIAPEQRTTYRQWIASQLGNVYEVRGIGVRAPRLGPPLDATVVVDVNRAFPGEFYAATTRIAVEQVQNRWYLSEPLLATD